MDFSGGSEGKKTNISLIILSFAALYNAYEQTEALQSQKQ